MAWSIPKAVFVVLALAAQARATPATDAIIAEIAAALEKGDATQAVRLADGGLAEKDTSALQRGRLLLDRGLAHELEGAQGDALIDFTAALQTRALAGEERGQALLQRGFLLDAMDKLEDAAADYTTVIALKTRTTANALNNRANVYRRQNRLNEARRDYLAALAAGSEHPQYPYYGLGQIAEALHDSQAARGFYAKAVAADSAYGLAADRLAALGGPPDGSLSEPDQIVLRPPRSPLTKPSALPHASARLHSPRPRRLPPAAAEKVELRPALDGPSSGTGPEVQLGAWRSEPEAQAGWAKARAQAGGALNGMSAHVVMADLPGKGRYFRLRVETSNPAGLCAELAGAGMGCLQVRD